MSDLSLAQINGRFKLLDRPMAAPGKCAVCGAVDRPVIDFDFDLDYYGVVYFCVGCLLEAAGLVEKPETGRATAELLEIKARTDEYVRNAMHDLNLFALGVGSIISNDSAASTAEYVSVKKSESEPDDTVTNDDPIVIDEGPDGVPSGSSDGLGIFGIG